MTKRLRLLVASLAAVVVLVGAGIWWYLGDDPPAEVSLESAIASVDDAAAASTTDGSATDGGSTGGSDGGPAEEASAPASGVEGTWVVDAETGGFDDESATGTFVGFRITEELATIGATEAVGRTGDVTGSITIEGTTLTSATIEADVTTITTNESRRDDKVQEALETDQYATATFVLTEPVDLGQGAADGAPVAVPATGELTVHGVTRSVQVPLDAQLVDGTVVVVGSLDIVFADHAVEVPTAPVVLSVEDHGTLELQVLLVRP